MNEACGSFNSFLKSRFYNFKLTKYGVKAKLSYLLDSNKLLYSVDSDVETLNIKQLRKIAKQLNT